MSAKTLHPVADPATQTLPPEAVYPGAPGHDHAAPVLPAGFEAQADELITHYPVSKRSASLPLLHHWQEAVGYIFPEGVEWIAGKVEVQPITILELETVYPQFLH